MHHGNSKVAQLRVEEWLAAVPPPFLYPMTTDVNELANGNNNGNAKRKDCYGKVIELYCLALLPRNEEWEFANTFIDTNEYLSKSKKKVCLLV